MRCAWFWPTRAGGRCWRRDSTCRQVARPGNHDRRPRRGSPHSVGARHIRTRGALARLGYSKPRPAPVECSPHVDDIAIQHAVRATADADQQFGIGIPAHDLLRQTRQIEPCRCPRLPRVVTEGQSSTPVSSAAGLVARRPWPWSTLADWLSSSKSKPRSALIAERSLPFRSQISYLSNSS